MGEANARILELGRELLRRRRARESLVAYSQSITIPGAPVTADDDDSWVFQPVETGIAAHHVLTMQAIERCIRKPMGRLIILEPPGSAKSTYTSVVAPTWAMGAFPGLRVLMTSYAGKPIIRHSKRARQIVASREYRSLWPEHTTLVGGSNAADEWELTNGSGLFAAGLLGGITSSRADLGIIDDPVAGREEAESETIRAKTRAAYDDDFLTRLKPNASVILITTRWHPQDLAGSILPEDYAGESGVIRCRDGLDWEVLCIPAKAERADDPLGRQIGEYLWPEWFPREHWQQYENRPRTWASLYQQRPKADTGNQFEKEWFQWYDEEEVPAGLTLYGGSDYAVKEKETNTDDPDFTEHYVAGLDADGNLWVRDGWFKQASTDVGIEAEIALNKRWQPDTTFGESGVIEHAIKPLRRDMQNRAKSWTTREWLPSITDKVARASALRGLANARRVYLPRGRPWAERLVNQLADFPAGKHDDGVDALGLIVRGIDKMREAEAPPPPVQRRTAAGPFTRELLDADDRARAADAATRRRYAR